MDNKTSNKEISLDSIDIEYDPINKCFIFYCECGEELILIEELLKRDKLSLTCDSCFDTFTITNYNHLVSD